MVFHFFRKRDIVLPPPLRAANKTEERRTGGKSTGWEIGLSDGQRGRLERVSGHPRSLQKRAWLGSGRGLVKTVRRTGMSKPTVWRQRDRFLAEGVDGLPRDATRPPGKKPIAEDRVKAATDLAMSPPGIVGVRARHWTVRALVERMGMAVSTTRGIPRGTAPGRTR